MDEVAWELGAFVGTAGGRIVFCVRNSETAADWNQLRVRSGFRLRGRVRKRVDLYTPVTARVYKKLMSTADIMHKIHVV